jgi:hypothetical protein
LVVAGRRPGRRRDSKWPDCRNEHRCRWDSTWCCWGTGPDRGRGAALRWCWWSWPEAVAEGWWAGYGHPWRRRRAPGTRQPPRPRDRGNP